MNKRHIRTEQLSTFDIAGGKEVLIRINVPLHAKSWSNKPLEMYKNEAIDILRNNANALLEHLVRLSGESEIDLNIHGEAINAFAYIGKGLLQGMEAVENDFERFMEKPTERYTGDLDIDQLALALSGILGSEKLPKPLARGFDRVMTDFINSQLDLDEFNDDMNSPEYIARHLKAYGDKNV